MKTLDNIMVDLETMDSKPTSAITAIGAVIFNPTTGEYGDKFYTRVDLQSSMDAGLSVSGSTFNWWLTQSEDARKEIVKQGVPLKNALYDFAQFFPHGNMKVWGNGASFDNAILQNAFANQKMLLPWKFWNDRCYRTIKSMNTDIPFVIDGTAHNALDDAVSQARHLIALVDAMQ
jgi:hypothetical protein